MLTLNLNLLYTVVNILVLFLLLRKFLYKPVMNIIAPVSYTHLSRLRSAVPPARMVSMAAREI